jgi:hypothetical protein
VLAAAQAAASWARARRATWTNVPLPRPDLWAIPGPAEPGGSGDASAAAAPASRARRPGWPWRDNVLPALRRWTPRILAVGAVAAGIAAAVKYVPPLWKAAGSAASRVTTALPSALPASAPSTPAQPRPAAAAAQAHATPPGKPVGSLHVESTPSGARVLVDGTPRGTTPLTIDDVPTGRHTVTIQSSAGIVQRVIAVAPGTASEINESIFSGWVVVYAPFEITLSEGSRLLRLDDRGEIMLPAGPHELRLFNRALGFEEVRRVDLKPGDRATLSVQPQRTTMNVTATEPAEVWLDGARVGSTPLTAAPVDLGTHELLLRRASGGDRRMTVTATVQPVTINVDFSRPQD